MTVNVADKVDLYHYTALEALHLDREFRNLCTHLPEDRQVQRCALRALEAIQDLYRLCLTRYSEQFIKQEAQRGCEQVPKFQNTCCVYD